MTVGGAETRRNEQKRRERNETQRTQRKTKGKALNGRNTFVEVVEHKKTQT